MDLDFGTGDFTIEMWAYHLSNDYAGTLFYYTEAAAFSLVVAATTGLVTLNYRSSGGTQASIATGVTFPLATWQHVVVQRRGTNFEFYLHGVLSNTTAITGGASSTVNSAGAFYLGRTNTSSALSWNGYIDEVRVTKGVARYPTSFTPPALPSCGSTENDNGSTSTPPVPPPDPASPEVDYVTPMSRRLSSALSPLGYQERALFKMNGQVDFIGSFGVGTTTSTWFSSTSGAVANTALEYRVISGSIYSGEVGPTAWAPFSGDFLLSAPTPGAAFGATAIAQWEVREVADPGTVYVFTFTGFSFG
jgi:hypothetical protein